MHPLTLRPPPRAATALTAAHRVAYGRDPRSAADAYARWREESGFMGAAYEATAAPGTFRAAARRLDLPQAALAEFDYCAMSHVRAPARVRADGCDVIWVQLTHRGGMRGRFGEREAVAGPGSAIFCDMAQPEAHLSVASRGRLLVLPRSAFGGADVAHLHGRVVTGPAAERLDAYCAWLARRLPRAGAAAEERVRAAMGAVVRATFDRGAEAALQDDGALDGLALARLRDLIRGRLPSGEVEPAALARALEISRASLYRLAEPHGGVMALVWELRLEAARAALSDPAQRGAIGRIGALHGFSSPQHFSRRFRERFGFSPSDLRPFRPAPARSGG